MFLSERVRHTGVEGSGNSRMARAADLTRTASLARFSEDVSDSSHKEWRQAPFLGLAAAGTRRVQTIHEDEAMGGQSAGGTPIRGAFQVGGESILSGVPPAVWA